MPLNCYGKDLFGRRIKRLRNDDLTSAPFRVVNLDVKTPHPRNSMRRASRMHACVRACVKTSEQQHEDQWNSSMSN